MPVEKKFWATTNQKSITARLLELEKKLYLEQNKELNEYEKEWVKITEKEKWDILEQNIRRWKEEILPNQDKKLRGEWEEHFCKNKKVYWKHTGKVNFNDLKTLVANNWNNYFTTAKKLAELQADFSLNYKSSTSRPQKIKCLETNYNDLANLDLISERQVVLERDFDGKKWNVSLVQLEKKFLNSFDTAKKTRSACELLTICRQTQENAWNKNNPPLTSWKEDNIIFKKENYDDLKSFAEADLSSDQKIVWEACNKMLGGVATKILTKYKDLQGWTDFFVEHDIKIGKEQMEWKKIGLDGAKNVYGNAYQNDADGVAWEVGLDEQEKQQIKKAKTPDQVKEEQENIAWQRFFTNRNITVKKEKNVWRTTSGLTLAEAKTVYQNGWKKLVDNQITNLQDGKITYFYPGLPGNIDNLELLRNDKVELDNALKLFAERILGNNDINSLPTDQEIEGVYEESKVEVIKYSELKGFKRGRKLELFKTAFEGNTPSGITDNNEHWDWLNNDTGLAENGTEERKVFDNGWTEPKKISGGLVKYVIPSLNNSHIQNRIFDTSIDIEVKKIKKIHLDRVRTILNDIRDKNDLADLPDLPVDYTEFSANIDNLPGDDALPTGYKKIDVINFYNARRQRLVDKEFINDFRAVGEEATNFASNPANWNAVLAYHKTGADMSGNHREITGIEAGQIFNHGWDATEIDIDLFGEITANYESRDWNPLNTTKAEADKEIWVTRFKNGDTFLLTDPEILNYRKQWFTFGSDLFFPPQKARRVCDNHWAANQFNYQFASGDWEATINTYTSHGQTDTDLDALIINRKELDKVNDIIKQIKNAKSLSDLPAETDIDATKYLENKVPTTKNHVAIKNQIKDKKAQLGQDAAEITARNNAIQAVKDHWKSLKMTGQVADVCGNNWENNFSNLKGSDITTEKNRLITLINEAKIQPDLTDIEAELNKKPVVSSSELKNSDYKTEMINLVRNDSQRTTQKQEIIKKINQIRENKLEAVRQIISQAQNIFNKDAATKEELEKVINDLKILANASQDSAEQIIWIEKEAENKKLLIDLETKLSKITPPDPEKEEPKDPGIPTPPSSPISQEEVEKYGAEFANLKPTQQEGRKTIVENWKKEVNYDRSKTCRYCPQEFHYDKSLEFLASQKKVDQELKTHEDNCSEKNNANHEASKASEWEKTKKSTKRYFYACRHCWGKIELDKSIKDWDEAKKQARADLAYHEEHECGNNLEKPKIAIYFSPNQGGNEHADLTYAEKINESELTLEKDNQGEIYQEQAKPTDNKSVGWTPWVIGGGVLVGGILLIWLVVNKKSQKNKMK